MKLVNGWNQMKVDEGVVWSNAADPVVLQWNICLFLTNSCNSVGCILYFRSVGQGYKSDLSPGYCNAI